MCSMYIYKCCVLFSWYIICSPAEATNESTYGCQEYFYVTGLPPATGSKFLSEKENRNKCSIVLKYTETPYNLQIGCHFKAKNSKGYSELKLEMKGIMTDIEGVKSVTSVQHDFRLEEEHDGRNITCSLWKIGKDQPESYIHIILKYEPPTTTTPTTTTSTPTLQPSSKSDAEEEGYIHNQLSGSGSGVMKYVGYGVAALVVVVLAIVVFIVGRRTCQQEKLEQRREQNDFTYENFQNENTYETQFPPNLENAYSTPYDSMRRPCIVDDASEISPYAVANYQGNAPSDAYSVPYVEKDISKLYSKPIPKSQRKELMYSQVLPKNMRKPKTGDVKPEEISYAELETAATSRNQLKPADTTYSEVVTGTDYNNVVPPNSRYCNAKDTEYAEPAYCELVKDSQKMIDRKK